MGAHPAPIASPVTCSNAAQIRPISKPNQVVYMVGVTLSVCFSGCVGRAESVLSSWKAGMHSWVIAPHLRLAC